MNKTQILVVEDDSPIRNLITTTLKTNNYRYLTAVNGESAISQTASHNPDIILLDLGLPDIDGVEVNVNVTFQQNKLLSLSGMYGGENISAPEYKSLASLDGAGFHGGYNHIVYQMVGQPLGVFYLPHCKGLIADGNGGYTYDIADLNGGGVSLEFERSS